ncbi:MAG: thioredoxin fold domain-containing protein [Gammaproteobacteria bacterium]|nr:thioredoxin fold domain-containing protein [Gammaproteobacteria bacterium]
MVVRAPGRSLLLFILPILLLFVSSRSPVLQAAEQGRFLGAMETVYPGWFQESFLDLREDIAEAASEGRRVVIFFHQDGCPYCNLLVERNLSQKDIQDTMKQKFAVIELNMFGDREVTALDGRLLTEKAFAAGLKVQFTPTLLFFDERGRVVLRLNGYVSPQKFKVALDYVSSHGDNKGSYREYLALNRPPEPEGALAREDFFLSPPFDLSSRRGRPLILLFEQSQCPDCDRLHQEVLSDPEIGALLKRYDAVQLDMWSGTALKTPDGRKLTAREWAGELGVIFAPTFILLGPDGSEIIRSEAVFKRFHTASILDYGLDGHYLRQPNFQRFLSARAEHIREQGRDVDIWK